MAAGDGSGMVAHEEYLRRADGSLISVELRVKQIYV